MSKVVQEARSWLDTPFHHQARKKGVGVDCVGLVICVAREVGFVAPEFDVTGYSRVPDGTQLMQHLNNNMNLVAQADMQPGDVVCVAFDKYPQHVGIVADYCHGGLSIIHAASKSGKVVETRLMFSSAMRFVGAFRFVGVA